MHVYVWIGKSMHFPCRQKMSDVESLSVSSGPGEAVPGASPVLEKYYEFIAEVAGGKGRFKCRFCSTIRVLKMTKKRAPRLSDLREHVKQKHPEKAKLYWPSDRVASVCGSVVVATPGRSEQTTLSFSRYPLEKRKHHFSLPLPTR